MMLSENVFVKWGIGEINLARKKIGITKRERSVISQLLFGTFVFIAVSDPIAEILDRIFTSQIAKLLSITIIILIIASLTKLDI